jgi:hypothetical protein
MKIKVAQNLKNFRGDDLKNDEGKIMTVREVLINGLTFEDRNTRKLSPAQKVRAYHLGLQITQQDEITLTSEEIVQIKQGVEEIYGSLIYGQIAELLEK